MTGQENQKQPDNHMDGYAEELRILEAVLFAAKEPVPLKELAEHLPEERREDTDDIVKMLQFRYEGRGVGLVYRDGAWAFRTAPDLAGKLRIEREVPKKLSRAAMETLAIIAYHQPVTRAEIENIRGVSTGKGTLDILMEIGWIKPGRRRQIPGRPLTWITAPQFLDHFGLGGIDELPGLEELNEAGLIDSRAAIDTLGQSDMFQGADDEADINPDAGDDIDIEHEVDIIDLDETEEEKNR